MNDMPRLFGNFRPAWPAASLRAYLLVMMLLCVLPFAGLITYQIFSDGNLQLVRLHESLERSAKTLAQSANREIESTVGALNIISHSTPIQSGEFDGFDRFENFEQFELFKQVLRAQALLRPNWNGIYLVSLSGEVLFDTDPAGLKPYAPERDTAELRGRPAEQRVFVSNLLRDANSAYFTAVEVPVHIGGVLRYRLGARIPIAVWQSLVEGAGISAEGNAALFDANHRLVARNRTPELFIGSQRPTASLKMIEGKPSGSGRLSSFEGGSSYAAWDSIPLSGWHVGIGMPAAPIDAAHRLAIARALGVAAVFLLLGVLLAFAVARQMTKPLEKLSHNEIPSPGEHIPVHEIALLRDALAAFQLQSKATEERLKYKRDLLQKRANEFETLLTSSPIGLAFAQDRECRLITHNPAMDSLFGTSDSHGRGYVEVFHEGRVLPPEDQPLQRAAALGETTRDMELELIIDGGPPTVVIVNAVPLRDAAGQPCGAIGAVVDITERKAAEARLISAEQNLRESQRLVDLAQEAGHVGFFHYKVEQDLLSWTPGLAKLFGLSDSTPGNTLADWTRFVDRHDLKRVERKLIRAMAARQDKETFDYAVKLNDGSAFWLSSRVQLIYSGNGRLLHMVGVAVDLTEHKEAERERSALIAREQASRLEAESANRSKDIFLAMLGHELRNPLSAITSAIEVLNRVGAKSEPELNAHRILARQSRHLAHMLDDLLDVARVISGHIALARQNLELAARVQRIVDTLEITGRPNEHSLTLDLHEVWIDADATRIEQIVNNLLTNAIKYTPPGGSIKVRVIAEDGDALLEVSNSGPGIAPELLPRVFDLFVQGERELDRRDGGLGVGLTLVRRLVELHGGRISAENSDEGTLVSVRLPAVVRPVAVARSTPLRESLRQRIAVIEDNEDVLEALHNVLEIEGHTVWTATDGVSGLALLLNVRPEVAIVDIGLPGLTGFAVAKRSRAGGYAGRMIAVSGYGHARDIEQALAAGFDDYLLKPLDLQKLRGMLAGDQTSDGAAQRPFR